MKNCHNEPMQGQVENHFSMSGQSFSERGESFSCLKYEVDHMLSPRVIADCYHCNMLLRLLSVCLYLLNTIAFLSLENK